MAYFKRGRNNHYANKDRISAEMSFTKSSKTIKYKILSNESSGTGETTKTVQYEVRSVETSGSSGSIKAINHEVRSVEASGSGNKTEKSRRKKKKHHDDLGIGFSVYGHPMMATRRKCKQDSQPFAF